MKPLIGIFRIAMVFVLGYGFGLPILDTFEIKIMVSKLVHSGEFSDEFRNSASVSFIMFVILSVISFYIIQSFVYIFAGSSLEGKNTGLFRFIGYVISGLRECFYYHYFWSTNTNTADYSRIEDVLSYRDNKMALMTDKEAAEYIKGTGHLEYLMTRKDLKHSRRMLSYLNNKLAFMDNEMGLDYLKNQKS